MAASGYQFGDFRLDCGRFELLRNGRPVRLENKPLELLILLLESDGRLVTRAEIAQHLWSSGVFVDTEHGINTAIRKIRRVLGDNPGNPRFIETIASKGYRFSAPVLAIAPFGSPLEPAPSASSRPPRRPAALRKAIVAYIAAGASVLFVTGATAFYRSRQRPPRITYAQLTDFTGAAVAPALSPDGRTVAFIRGSNPFLSRDQIYVKMLPDGEARQVTHDRREKYGLAFSPDGSQIGYTVADSSGFATYAVSVLGGQSHLLMQNAAGLVWLSPREVLFSQIRSGIHMGIVSATVTRTRLREIYFPSHERAMAHYAFPSPNRQWALVVEMNGEGDWAPCRLISLTGRHAPRSVGPDGGCTSAGWAPDGTGMYFSARVNGHSHLWTQHFPDGVPEQITFGPSEEDGVAVAPTGHALITSVGEYQSAVWIHDPHGDRPLSSEGEVVTGTSLPAFSSDGQAIYYLLQRGRADPDVELWRTSVGSGKSAAVLPGISMIAYEVSPDGKQVVYASPAAGGTTQLWLAPIDRSSAPAKVGGPGGTSPHFGSRGRILFQQTEGNDNYLEQMNRDGSNRSKVVPYPVIDVQGVSPARRWVMADIPNAPGGGPGEVAIPMDGAPPRRICAGYCVATWSTSGKFIFVALQPSSRTRPGRTLAIPVGPGETLPELPPGGIPARADPSLVKGSWLIPRSGLVPGGDPSHFAFVKATVHRNLYRISLH